MKNKGLSEVVSTVIMIGLVLLAVTIMWSAVNFLIQGKIDDSKSCFGSFEKVTLEKKYTCVDDVTKAQFLINIGDVDVDEVLVSITGEEGTSMFKISNEDKEIDGGDLAYLNGVPPQQVKLPSKNSGKTYVYYFGSEPTSVQIAPIIDGTQCDVSDAVSNLDDCDTISS